MTTPVHGRAARFALAALSLTLLSACDTPAGIHNHESTDPAFVRVGTGGITGMAKQVRQATARYHSTTQATRGGYAEASECVAVPGLGGMGFHWVNFGLVDPVFDPLKPEAVLYEPDADGELHLVAVEYVVVDIGQPRPSFEGRLFDVGGAGLPVDHWTLHVWVHKDNPNGLMTPFNPSVSCP